MDHLNYTEVNKETFEKWSLEFQEQLKAQEELSKTEADLRQTGKEWFLSNRSDLNIMLLEEKKEEDTEEEKLEDNEFEVDDDEEDRSQVQGALYDKSLFTEDVNEDEEEPDFE